jgi:hypothetical protein
MSKPLKSRGYSAQDVFHSALQFHQACQFLRTVDHENKPEIAAFVGNPSMALSALTLELLLKTMHALHSEYRVPQIHHLGHLFRGLSSPDQAAVQACWDPVFLNFQERWEQMRRMAYRSEVKPLTPSVIEALDAGALTFEKARYGFDQSKNFDYYVDDLRVPLIDLIVSRQPHFGVWRVTQTHTSWVDLAHEHGTPPKEEP